jgi:HlyD family secretion protein/adhesin transport system membrane fusion protein
MAYTRAQTPFSMNRQLHMLARSAVQWYRQWCNDDVEHASQSLALEETRLPRLVTLTMITLSAATGLFILWAALTPVKELARTEGQVLPAGYNQIVQHLEGGLVEQILVHEGDFVQHNQPLLRLGGAGMEEDFREGQDQVTNLALDAARLTAIIENRKPDFSGLGATATQIAQAQRMYDTTLASNTAERSVLDEQIAEKKNMIARLAQALSVARSNYDAAAESSGIYANLQKQGLVSRTNYLKNQEELNTRRGDAAALARQIAEGKNELAEYQNRRAALDATQKDTANAELGKVQADLAQAREGLKKREDRVSRLEVRAPVMGYVKGLRVNTIGAVIPAGQTLMEIVPVDEQLIVEARILPQQIGRVAVGQTVQVKVDSYDYVRYGMIEGKLESISAMTFTDDIRRQDYYKGRVLLSHNYAGPIPGQHPLLPGMTVDVDIVTGEKSVLGYLLKPIQVAMHNAMTEQ